MEPNIDKNRQSHYFCWRLKGLNSRISRICASLDTHALFCANLIKAVLQLMVRFMKAIRIAWSLLGGVCSQSNASTIILNDDISLTNSQIERKLHLGCHHDKLDQIYYRVLPRTRCKRVDSLECARESRRKQWSQWSVIGIPSWRILDIYILK